MAQLRHNHQKFVSHNTEVVVLVPNGPRMIHKYRSEHNIPYLILSDKGSIVAGQYMQIKRFFKIGTPTVILVNREGRVIYTHYAKSVIEEPDINEPLKILATLKDQAD